MFYHQKESLLSGFFSLFRFEYIRFDCYEGNHCVIIEEYCIQYIYIHNTLRIFIWAHIFFSRLSFQRQNY